MNDDRDRFDSPAWTPDALQLPLNRPHSPIDAPSTPQPLDDGDESEDEDPAGTARPGIIVIDLV